MLIIGEKLNGTLKKTAAAITARDADFVQDLARKQVEAGADYLDVNAGTGSGQEADDLVWLVETVQSVVDVPLCLDSANPVALKSGMECVQRTPMVNSISGEASRLDDILPLVTEAGSPVIALLLSDSGIPDDVEERLRIGHHILERTRQAGVPDEKVFIDPLAMAISTKTDGALMVLETMRVLREENSKVKFSIGLSNISFGLPARTLVNQAFLAQLLATGLDAAIINPMEQGLVNMLYATEMILGRDRFCRNYTTAFRKGKVKLETAV
jgi:5-methyltetrahydrofolate corrinoid/iron sulfur protein methyltransferase